MPTDEVTDADRFAYLSLNMLPEFDRVDVLDGRWDKATGIQAFAAHRTASEQRGYDRAIAEVVAWLRWQDGHGEWYEVAEQIEAGEHKP